MIIAVATDLEVDDLLSIALMCKASMVPKVISIDYAESFGKGKLAVAGEVLRLCAQNAPCPQLHLKHGSHHWNYPAELADVFPDGAGYSAEWVISDDAFREQLQNAPEGSVLVLLRPFEDLLDLSAEVAGRLRLWVYGSYNIRCQLDTVPGDRISEFLLRFRECRYFETFAALGAESSARPGNCPEIFRALSLPANREWRDLLCKTSKCWDAALRKVQCERIEKLEKKERGPGAADPLTEPGPGAADPQTEPGPGAADPLTEPGPGAADPLTEPGPGAADPLTERERQTLERSRKVVASIDRARAEAPDDFQVVMADCGLLAWCLGSFRGACEEKSVSESGRVGTRRIDRIVFDPVSGYSKYVEYSDGGSVALFVPQATTIFTYDRLVARILHRDPHQVNAALLRHELERETFARSPVPVPVPPLAKVPAPWELLDLPETMH
ncbi:MAG: hypothetical protein ACYCOU_04105 [Sulfobacillus sp.]